MSYTRTNWEDLPSTNTPINAINLNNIEDGIEDLNLTVGIGDDTYDNTATYSVGDKVVYENKIYECNTAISTAEDFDSSKWDLVPVIDSMKINDKLLKTKNINLTINTDYVYSTDWDYTCIKIGNVVFLSINTIAFKVGNIPNFGVLLSNLPKPSTEHIFWLAPRHANIENFRVRINLNGQLVRHYAADPEYGSSSDNQYHGSIIYFTND